MLGIVSDEYEVVENRDAFRFLDALIGLDMQREPVKLARQAARHVAAIEGPESLSALAT